MNIKGLLRQNGVQVGLKHETVKPSRFSWVPQMAVNGAQI
jgi:hypothetical protein